MRYLWNPVSCLSPSVKLYLHNTSPPLSKFTLNGLNSFQAVLNFSLLLLSSDNLIAEAAGGNASAQALKEADEKAFQESEVNSITPSSF